MNATNPTTQPVDFFAFNAANQVWNGTAFVAWSDADFASYRIPATSTGGGRVIADDVPLATSFELRIRAGTVAASSRIYEGELLNAMILAKLQDAAPGEAPVVVIPAPSDPSLCHVYGVLTYGDGSVAAGVDFICQLISPGALSDGNLTSKEPITITSSGSGVIDALFKRNDSLLPEGSKWGFSSDAMNIKRTDVELNDSTFDIGTLIPAS